MKPYEQSEPVEPYREDIQNEVYSEYQEFNEEKKETGVWLNILLFILTFISTTLAGVYWLNLDPYRLEYFPLVFFLYQIVGGLISYFMLGENMEINSDNLNVTRIVLTFAQFMFILAPAIVLVMLQDNNIKETFRLKLPKINLMVYSIIGLIFVQPFLQVFLYFQNELIFSLPFGTEFLNQLKEMFDMLESTTVKLVTADSIPEFLLVILVIAITPAICEEFLFRGLVFKNFEKILPASKAIFFFRTAFRFVSFSSF